jgi:hypothetical protein
VELRRQPGCWLRSSHTFKECVIAHWSSDSAPKIQRGSSLLPKLRILRFNLLDFGVVGERFTSAEAVSQEAVEFVKVRMPV